MSVYPNGEQVFLLKDKPKLSARQLSNGYWVNVNLSIKDLVFTIGRLCQFCDVDLKDVDIRYAPKQSSGLYRNMINTDSCAKFAQKNVRDAFRVWLKEHNPEWSNGTVTMHYSDAYYLYNNARGISLEEALAADNGLQKAYDVIEQFYTANPTQTNNPSGSARGYVRSLRMLKEFLEENHPDLLTQNGNSAIIATTIPDEIIEVLYRNYSTGFRFETTALRLLSAESDIEISGEIQNSLKRFLFRRNDDVYFLPDIIADAETRKEIVEFADEFLDEYGFFEISELHALFAENINDKCIYDTDSFESFYLFINKRNVRCVAANGTQIARVQNENVRTLFSGVADKALAIIQDKFGGVAREDDLRVHFSAISTELLSSIIGDYIEDIVRTEINGIICYQTLDTLGLPDDFSEMLSELLSRLDELELSLTDEVLHTALSLTLGVNFKTEYNIPNDKTYRRLIALYYEGTPEREWKYGKFAEVRD